MFEWRAARRKLGSCPNPAESRRCGWRWRRWWELASAPRASPRRGPRRRRRASLRQRPPRSAPSTGARTASRWMTVTRRSACARARRRHLRAVDARRPRADAGGVRAAHEAAAGDADRLLDQMQACGELVGSGILRVPESELIAVAWPLANVPTGITVTVQGGKPAFARCAIDALGVAQMIRKQTVVEAEARDNGARLRVVVDGDKVTSPSRPAWWSSRARAATTCRSSRRSRRPKPGSRRTPAKASCSRWRKRFSAARRSSGVSRRGCEAPPRSRHRRSLISLNRRRSIQVSHSVTFGARPATITLLGEATFGTHSAQL